MSTTPSTTIITNLKSVTLSTANTLKNANTNGIDMSGMLALALVKAAELKVCLTLIVRSTDSADANLTALDGILASLA
ncbi:MAG: hypothetical protein WAM78_02575 [Candidatus Sulfotelmatobacter sp.]